MEQIKEKKTSNQMHVSENAVAIVERSLGGHSKTFWERQSGMFLKASSWHLTAYLYEIKHHIGVLHVW